MIAEKWNGIGGYDLIITLNEDEMREMTDYYYVDFDEYIESRGRKDWEGEYYCFVCFRRRAIALIPFLAIAFGGQYNDESPIGEPVEGFSLNYADYHLEEFLMRYVK